MKEWWDLPNWKLLVTQTYSKTFYLLLSLSLSLCVSLLCALLEIITHVLIHTFLILSLFYIYLQMHAYCITTSNHHHFIHFIWYSSQEPKQPKRWKCTCIYRNETKHHNNTNPRKPYNVLRFSITHSPSQLFIFILYQISLCCRCFVFRMTTEDDALQNPISTYICVERKHGKRQRGRNGIQIHDIYLVRQWENAICVQSLIN